MTSRIQSIAALVMIGAALAASPALAAALTAGNKGPAERPENREAPLTLPGGLAAGATPRVDAGTLSRGLFDQDPDTALAGLATITLERTGDVTETPASDALRGIFETAIEGHRPAN